MRSPSLGWVFHVMGFSPRATQVSSGTSSTAKVTLSNCMVDPAVALKRKVAFWIGLFLMDARSNLKKGLRPRLPMSLSDSCKGALLEYP